MVNRIEKESGSPSFIIRNAEPADIPGLVGMKGEWSEALHRDRLRDAEQAGFRYLVLTISEEFIGFACLVYKRPNYWSDGGDPRHLPQIVDLQVKESWRGQGFGSAFIRAIEGLAEQDGCHQLFIGVEPQDNPRAYTLYQRLGYRQEQPEPYLQSWEFIDSAGQLHHGENFVVDMVKQL